MDKDDTKLLKLLYTRIGITMEDASIIAIELGAPSSNLEEEKIEKLSKSVNSISDLTNEAKSLAMLAGKT